MNKGFPNWWEETAFAKQTLKVKPKKTYFVYSGESMFTIQRSMYIVQLSSNISHISFWNEMYPNKVQLLLGTENFKTYFTLH